MAAVAVGKKVVSIGHFSPSFYLQSLQTFLDASSHLYNTLCPSVGQLVGRVTHSFDDPHVEHSDIRGLVKSFIMCDLC